MVGELVNYHNLPFMGEHHEAEDSSHDSLHRVHVTPPKEEVVVQLSIDDFDVNQDCLLG